MSIKLKINDIKFLLSMTGLNLKQLLNLIEEDRDYDLVIEAVSRKLNINNIDIINNLSDKLKIKICIYYLSQFNNFDIVEKSIVSDIISNNYEYFCKTARRFKSGQKNEIKSFLKFIKSPEIDKSLYHEAYGGLRKIGYNNISIHLKDWFLILNKTKNIINC